MILRLGADAKQDWHDTATDTIISAILQRALLRGDWSGLDGWLQSGSEADLGK